MRCQRKCLAACPGFSSLLFSQAASEVVLLIPAVLGTHAELKVSPYLCYPCRHMEVAARDQQEGLFAFFAGAVTQGSGCAFLFSPFFLMRCTMEEGKANLIIKLCLPPLSVFPDWEVRSSSFWCKSLNAAAYIVIWLFIKNERKLLSV